MTEVEETETQPEVAEEVQPELLDLSLPPVPSKSDNPVVRVLTLDEIKQYVEPVFTENGALLPSWTNSFFVGAVDDSGKVLCFITVQSVIHTEPMYAGPGASHFIPRVVKAAQAEVERVLGQCKVYFTADDERVVQLAERLGMQREPGIVLTKWVGPEPFVPIPEIDPAPAAPEGDSE